MSSFHALWSTSGLIGAQGFSPLAHLSFAALLVTALREVERKN